MPNYVALTGACGFIGRSVCRKLLAAGHYVYAIDALTYAADPEFPGQMQREYAEQFCFINNDIRHLGRWPDVDCVIHLAAETHVDNSLDTPGAFVETNVNGTMHLLEMTRRKRQQGAPFFVHVSTDEVYGSVYATDPAHVNDDLKPSSPYSASKAAAEMLVMGWGHTFDLPYVILRPCNAYGMQQYPEKLIPRAVRACTLNRPIPIHGDGSQTRSWLWVEDLADAILLVMDTPRDPFSAVLNIGGNTHASVIDVALAIARQLGGSVEMVDNRPGGDSNYSVDDSALRRLGWTPKGNFWQDLPGIVEAERSKWRF